VGRVGEGVIEVGVIEAVGVGSMGSADGRAEGVGAAGVGGNEASDGMGGLITSDDVGGGRGEEEEAVVSTGKGLA